MDYTRLLKKGSEGDDVLYIKKLLFELGYYSDDIKVILSKKFGNDTVDAVKRFQEKHPETGTKGKPDGEIGKKTWAAIVKEYNDKKPVEHILAGYTNISEAKRNKIEKDLVGISEMRLKIVKEILTYTYDMAVPGNTLALYIFGANLYNPNLKINYATALQVERSAKAHPKYFTGGRKAWMLDQINRNPYLPASDCSGMDTKMKLNFSLACYIIVFLLLS